MLKDDSHVAGIGKYASMVRSNGSEPKGEKMATTNTLKKNANVNAAEMADRLDAIIDRMSVVLDAESLRNDAFAIDHYTNAAVARNDLRCLAQELREV